LHLILYFICSFANKQNRINRDPLYYNLVDEDDESYEYAAETDPDAVSYEEEDFADDPGDRTLIAKGIQFTLFIDRYECQKKQGNSNFALQHGK
jgi:hypothetical protein